MTGTLATTARPHFRVTSPPRRPVALARLKLYLRATAVALAALQAWNGRFAVNPDGVSYLDIADAYRRGDWWNAINTYWSPLYSWLLAGATALLRPSPFWEFGVVKLVNFGVFLAALVAFERLLRELTLRRPERAAADENAATLPQGVFLVFAYALFIWSSCATTSVANSSPDLLVSLFVYLAAAEALRVRRARPTLARSLLLGLILGLGCLAKSVMLPVGLVFLGASAFAAGSFRKAAVHVAAAAAVLLVLFGGFVGAMSWKSGRVTLGDVSGLNYLWIVNGVPDHGWLTADPRFGAPVHPPERLACDIPAYEFSGQAAPCTYPLWYDPPRWCRGLTWRIDVRQQAAAVAAGFLEYYYIFFSHLGALTAALAAVHVGAWLAGGGAVRAALTARLRGLAADYPLLLPALAACGLYGLVVVEPRYLAGFVVLLGAAVIRCVRFPAARQSEVARWSWAVAVVLVLAPTGWMVVQQAAYAVRDAVHGDANTPLQVAEGLQRRGARPGDKVAHIGSSFNCGWARAGRFHIAAEVRTADADDFWTTDPARQEQVLDAFRRAGATAVVGNPPPGLGRDWERIPGTEYAVRMLSATGGSDMLPLASQRPLPTGSGIADSR